VTFDVRLLPNARRDFERIEAYYDAEVPSQTERFIE
jgi:plasmid stabilization system protein ParE